MTSTSNTTFMQAVKTSVFLSLLTAGNASLALPEDAAQPGQVSSSRWDASLDTGEITHYGTEQEPATFTKGSIKISGLELQLLSKDSKVVRIIATGKPARFQQVLTLNEPPVHGSGDTLIFNNDAQQLSVDGNGEISQQGKFNASHHHFDFDLETKTLHGPAGTNGEQGQMVFPGNGPR